MAEGGGERRSYLAGLEVQAVDQAKRVLLSVTM